MICSTLTGKLSILHPVVRRFVREDGAVLNRPERSKNRFEYTYGSFNHNKYKMVTVNQKSIFVHVLVAQCFIPNPLSKSQVDHINRIRDDNRIQNLRWSTPKENMDNAGCVVNSDKRCATRSCENLKEYSREHQKCILHYRDKDGMYRTTIMLPEDFLERLRAIPASERLEPYSRFLEENPKYKNRRRLRNR